MTGLKVFLVKLLETFAVSVHSLLPVFICGTCCQRRCSWLLWGLLLFRPGICSRHTCLIEAAMLGDCHPVWVPGLRIDPLHLLAGCRERRLSQAPLNLRGLIWLLMMVWSKRGNINTAALVTTVQCNTLARCSRQLIGPADWVFVILGPLRCD